MRRIMVVLFLLGVSSIAAPRAQESAAESAARKLYDQILDLNVRDGFVYYRALKGERGKLDGYVTQLGSVSIEKASRDAQIAFWLNAYNAIVLKTVVDHYPIQGHSTEYPGRSIRQISGAFDRLQHRVAGRMLTLDQIEQTVLAGFKDPRLYLAIGRGAVGGGRLRSEAFDPGRLEAQLAEVASECATRAQCIQVDRGQNTVSASAIFSWRQKDFIAAYADSAPAPFANRSPIERAILAFVEPRMLTTEKEFLAKNQFQLVYRTFDWTLNDLTGRGGR
jgi:uncharacterized protein DUF547